MQDQSTEDLKMKIIIVLILAALTTTSWASDRCMWLAAIRRNILDDNMVKNLMCVAHFASGFNINHKRDELHHGVFQVSARKWCHDPRYTSQNLCNMPCSFLHNQNLDDDVKCAAIIARSQGFTAWSVWRQNCANRDLGGYLSCV